jgi:hypothetical protein
MIDGKDLERLSGIILNRTGNMEIIVEMVDEVEATKAGKWKFIVNEIKGIKWKYKRNTKNQ